MMKKTVNYIFLIIFLFYFTFLISRVVLERLPRDIILFCIIYVFFAGISFILPKIFIGFRNLGFKTLVPGKKEKPKGFFKKSFEKIKTIVFSFLIKIAIAFKKDFFSKFLGLNFKVMVCFFFLIKLLTKISHKYFLFLISIVQVIFLITFFYELATKEKFLLTLYVLSFLVLIKVVIKVSLWIACQFTLGLGHQKFITYLGKIHVDDDLQVFFVNNPSLKELFFDSIDFFKTKRFIIFFWDLFKEIYYFWELKLHEELLQVNIKTLERSFRILNITIFVIVFLIKFISQDLVLCFSILITLFVSFVSFLNVIKEDAITLSNKYHLRRNTMWFKLVKELLLKQYPFLKAEDLSYPFTLLKTPKELAVLSFEFRDICLSDEQDFTKFSEYALTREETLLLREGEKLVIDWYYEQVEKGVINPETFEINLLKSP